MGLDFNKSNAHWSYSGFNFFRKALAAEIGINLGQMEGFGGNLSWDNIADPIVPFLNHSDCEGELTSDECRAISPRLKKLVSNWEDGRDKEMAILLADDMETLANSGEPLIFQ